MNNGCEIDQPDGFSTVVPAFPADNDSVSPFDDRTGIPCSTLLLFFYVRLAVLDSAGLNFTRSDVFTKMVGGFGFNLSSVLNC